MKPVLLEQNYCSYRIYAEPKVPTREPRLWTHLGDSLSFSLDVKVYDSDHLIERSRG